MATIVYEREIGFGEAEDLNIFCRYKMLEQFRDFTLAIDIKLCSLNQCLRLKAVILLLLLSG